MLRITCLLLLLILTLPFSLHAQELFNPLMPKERGEDLMKLIQNAKKVFSSKSRLAKLTANNSAEFKRLFALRVLAQIENPVEVIELRKNKESAESEHIRTIDSEAYITFLEKKERYLALESDYNRDYFFDLYRGPFVFIGTITKVDTLCYTAIRTPVIQYEMSDLVNMNEHVKADLTAKTMAFIFSTAHRGRKMPEWFFDPNASSDETYAELNHVVSGLPSVHELRIGDRFLVFIAPEPNNSTCLKEISGGYNRLPYLRLTAMGNEGFPVESDHVVDVNRYFGQGERISIADVKKKINGVMDEIASWRD